MRAYYSADVADFLTQDARYILGALTQAAKDVSEDQKTAWLETVDILKNALRGIRGRLFLELEIPRMGKRADAVLIHSGAVFVIEFKVGSRKYEAADADQCMDYALDLKNFHEASHRAPVVPVLVATAAPEIHNAYAEYGDGVFRTVKANGRGLGSAIGDAAAKHEGASPIDPLEWERASYKPTPTIIEAARALYAKHDVSAITRNEAGAENLGKTTDAIEQIISHSKNRGKKSICFVTGIPGAGKTLAGLGLAGKRRDNEEGERALYVSGNGPLIKVLQEAFARDRVESNKQELAVLKKRLQSKGASKKEISRAIAEKKTTKKDALRQTKVMIQSLYNFMSDAVGDPKPPDERIVVFDEAQRAWDADATRKFLKERNVEPRDISQPELLIETMDRHDGWAVVVCLVGGGQEINHNETGLPEWFDSVRRSYPGWEAYVPGELADKEHLQGRRMDEMLAGIKSFRRPDLHLSTSLRSFRSGRVYDFVKALLDLDEGSAGAALAEITGKEYQIVVTRDFGRAKDWLRGKARGTERFGVVAAAKSYRLMPHGIYVQLAADAPSWFLNPPSDPRSSYSCEYAATEFKVQGLELDWACVAWDADLRRAGSGWAHHEFRGDKWTRINKEYKKKYLKNAYRVLLTRARQGMVVFVPEGDPRDETRKSEFYDLTYDYLKSIGVEEIPHAKDRSYRPTDPPIA